MRSADLVQRLIELEGRRAEFGRNGKSLTQNNLARLLKPLGIGPGNVGPENSRALGYKREQFEEAFERYLPPDGDIEVHRCTERDEIWASRISEPLSQVGGCAVGKSEKSNNDVFLGGYAVAGGDISPNGGDGSGLSDYRIREPARPHREPTAE